MSIDAPNTETGAGKASCDHFNYIDTCVEYIVEVILKFDNAIPESNHREHKEIQLHKHVQIVFQKYQPSLHIFCLENRKSLYQTSSDSYAFQFINEISPPPPKTLLKS